MAPHCQPPSNVSINLSSPASPSSLLRGAGVFLMEILSGLAAGAPPHTSDTPEELEEATALCQEFYMSVTIVLHESYNSFT